jgi:endogenous inhibitor of DNA gyrase (YacG/DUF329 family)
MEAKQIKCPQCGLLTFYSLENPTRPFCSERCRLIDLGQWADESFKIPSTNTDINPEDFDIESELGLPKNDDEEEA